MRTDPEIQHDLIQELRRDPGVDAADVGARVDRGVVLLTGHVATYAQRWAAQEAAHRVPGVLDVANDLDVRPTASVVWADQEVARAVRRTLEWDVLVPDGDIHSTVSDGWVTLDGTVDTWQERADVERAVRRLPGVRGLTNRLMLTAPAVHC